MKKKHLLAGLGWNTLGQFLVVGISLGLTPFLLHRLGATAYGIFVLVSSIKGLISNLDGGLGPTGYRYFPVYVGREDVAATTSLLITIISLVILIVGAECAAMILFAPAVAAIFAHGPGLAGHSQETVQLIRYLMPTLLILAIRTPIQRLVMAHHRWAFVNYTQVMAVVASTATTVALSYKTSGLQCLVWGAYAQEAVLFITVAWACRRYISLDGLHWLPISEVREILRFGVRVQVAAVASSLNNETDALLVGFFFPVKYVAYYGIGANFSQQVINMAYNGLNPIMQDIGRMYGKSGKKGVLRSFSDYQRTWVTIIGIFPVVAALEGWFGIRVWIGQDAQFAAATAALLVLGIAPLLLNSIVDVTAKVVEMPEIEAWYLGTGVAINLACTIPLALNIGVIGIPLGTAIGEVISFFVCIYLARKKIGKEITPFFWSIRYLPELVAVAIAGACEWVFRNSLPGGGIGFVLSGLLTVPAFITYYSWVYRDLLLKRLGIRVQAAEGRRGGIEHDDDDYAGRHVRGVQALLALAEPEVTSSFADRQLKGLQALLALAEPEMTVGPFLESSYRLRYTGPLKQLDERQLYLPPQDTVVGRKQIPRVREMKDKDITFLSSLTPRLSPSAPPPLLDIHP
jgi:O-antigen/teichoic acid export membrane protein